MVREDLTDDPPAVQVRDVVKSYGTKGTEVEALRGVSIEVRRGERVALLGKSGSGKSTLLNLIGGLDHVTSGDISVAGYQVDKMRSREAARFRLATVGFIFQSYNLIPSRTALQNVELPMLFDRRTRRTRRSAARDALQAVGLADRVTHRPAELSGGEQQRVAIARALVNAPQVLLADEPTGNLDSNTAEEIVRLLEAHCKAHGPAVILVTHDEELAGRFADRVLRMKDGQLAN